MKEFVFDFWVVSVFASGTDGGNTTLKGDRFGDKALLYFGDRALEALDLGGILDLIVSGFPITNPSPLRPINMEEVVLAMVGRRFGDVLADDLTRDGGGGDGAGWSERRV